MSGTASPFLRAVFKCELAKALDAGESYEAFAARLDLTQHCAELLRRYALAAFRHSQNPAEIGAVEEAYLQSYREEVVDCAPNEALAAMARLMTPQEALTLMLVMSAHYGGVLPLPLCLTEAGDGLV